MPAAGGPVTPGAVVGVALVGGAGPAEVYTETVDPVYIVDPAAGLV